MPNLNGMEEPQVYYRLKTIVTLISKSLLNTSPERLRDRPGILFIMKNSTLITICI